MTQEICHIYNVVAHKTCDTVQDTKKLIFCVYNVRNTIKC